jgi:hypothetical protein
MSLDVSVCEIIPGASKLLSHFKGKMIDSYRIPRAKQHD